MRRTELAVSELEELEPVKTMRNVDERRWYNVHHLVYEIDGRYWRVEQYEGATEYQEDIGPWSLDEDDPVFVEAVEVRPEVVTKVVYRPVE